MTYTLVIILHAGGNTELINEIAIAASTPPVFDAN
jgi:hypothetical protein